MGLLVYKAADYSFTAEREQYRTICNALKKKYADVSDLCLFIANYNLNDIEFDGIIIKKDAVISLEFKNYGGVVTAVENGNWTLADGTIIKGGSRKNPYQQAKINHINLRNGLADGMILPLSQLRNVPSIIVFNQPISCTNKLSGRVRSWLHITDNEHFIQKLSDITERCTNLSDSDIIGLINRLNLQEEWLDKEYSNNYIDYEEKDSSIAIDEFTDDPFIEQKEEMQINDSLIHKKGKSDVFSENSKVVDRSVIRVSSDRIEKLADNEIFVFGSNLAGKHIGGAARQAFQNFGAEWGVGNGPTGRAYAIPTIHGGIDEIAPYINQFIQYATKHSEQKFLVTKIGCGVAGFRPKDIAPLFASAAKLINVYLPAEFWLYIQQS